jgi:hypothetical protein
MMRATGETTVDQHSRYLDIRPAEVIVVCDRQVKGEFASGRVEARRTLQLGVELGPRSGKVSLLLKTTSTLSWSYSGTSAPTPAAAATARTMARLK